MQIWRPTVRTTEQILVQSMDLCLPLQLESTPPTFQEWLNLALCISSSSGAFKDS